MKDMPELTKGDLIRFPRSPLPNKLSQVVLNVEAFLRGDGPAGNLRDTRRREFLTLVAAGNKINHLRQQLAIKAENIRQDRQVLLDGASVSEREAVLAFAQKKLNKLLESILVQHKIPMPRFEKSEVHWPQYFQALDQVNLDHLLHHATLSIALADTRRPMEGVSKLVQQQSQKALTEYLSLQDTKRIATSLLLDHVRRTHQKIIQYFVKNEEVLVQPENASIISLQG